MSKVKNKKETAPDNPGETEIKKPGVESVVIEQGTPSPFNFDTKPKPEGFPDGIDPDRPYIFGADGKPIQMSPMDEKVFREDYGESESDTTMAIFQELQQEAKLVEEKVARTQVDPGVTDRMRKAVPKAGVTVARIEIHMRQVFNNVIGRRNVEGRANIIGLYSFGATVNRMVGAYRDGDKPCPYAAWYLWRVEQEILELRQSVTEYNDRVKALIENANVGIDFEPYTSSAPAIEILSFHAVHAFQVASVLNQYDDMLRRIWPYVRNHFVKRDDFAELLRYSTGIRRLFMLPTVWHYVGYDAVVQKTAMYQAARQRMGDVPDAFVTGEKSPEWV